MNSDNQNKAELEVPLSPAATSFSDIIHMVVRKDHNVLLQFISVLPEGKGIENHRTVINNQTAKSLIDQLSGLLDHYPQKKKSAKKTGKS